jgi:hypothetical protein
MMNESNSLPETIIWKGQTVVVRRHRFSDLIGYAQTIPNYTIYTKRLPRIPFGNETSAMPLTRAPAVDYCSCGTYRTLLHLPGCEFEQCPACLGQRSRCDCPWDDLLPLQKDTPPGKGEESQAQKPDYPMDVQSKLNPLYFIKTKPHAQEEPYDRIPFGNETDVMASKVPSSVDRCPACGTSRGFFHEMVCTYEQCPSCGEAAHICPCHYEEGY